MSKPILVLSGGTPDDKEIATEICRTSQEFTKDKSVECDHIVIIDVGDSPFESRVGVEQFLMSMLPEAKTLSVMHFVNEGFTSDTFYGEAEDFIFTYIRTDKVLIVPEQIEKEVKRVWETEFHTGEQSGNEA